MKRIFILFFFGGWFCSSLYAQDDQEFFSVIRDKKQTSRILAKDGISHNNLLQDNNGDVVFLELCGTKETEYFLDNYQNSISRFKLKTLIIRDFASKNYFDKLLDFIKTQGASLQNLYFKRHDGKSMPQEFLMPLIDGIRDFSVIEFKWENQDAIDDPALADHLSKIPSFWNKLKTLSFNKTKIREKAFFIHRISFDSLQTLELAETALKYNLLDSLVSHAENFPSLRFLNLNDVDFNEKSMITSDKVFASLKTVTIYKERSYLKNFNILFSNNNSWIKSAESVVINLRRNIYQKPYKDIHMTTDGSFIYDYGKPLAMNNLGDDGLFFTWFPNLKFSGSFQRPTENGPDSRLDSMGLKLVLASQEDIDIFLNKYPVSRYNDLVLFSPDINKYHLIHLLRVLKNKSVCKTVSLIHTRITYPDYDAIRQLSDAEGTQINIINTSANAPIISYRFNNNTFFDQQFHQQMMKDALKNIPKGLR